MKFMVLLLIMVVYAEQVHGKNDTRKPNAAATLYKKLMDSYDRLNPDSILIPQYNVSKPIKVNFGLSLQALVDFDESTDVATFETWDFISWNDEFLHWNPEEHEGIRSILVRSEKIWRPEIKLFNALHHCAPTTDTLMVVYSSGKVSYVPIVQRKVLCGRNDTGTVITCPMQFGSWTRDGTLLDVDLPDDTAHTSTFRPHKHYELLCAAGVKNTHSHTCCPGPYVDIMYKLVFQKRENSAWWDGRK